MSSAAVSVPRGVTVQAVPFCVTVATVCLQRNSRSRRMIIDSILRCFCKNELLLLRASDFVLSKHGLSDG